MFAKSRFLLLLAAFVPTHSHSAESVNQVVARQQAEEIAAAERKAQLANPQPILVKQGSAQPQAADGVLGIGGYGTHLRADIIFNGINLPVKAGDSLPGAGGWRVHEVEATSVVLAVYDKKGKAIKKRVLNFIGYTPVQSEIRTPMQGVQGGPDFVPAITQVGR